MSRTASLLSRVDTYTLWAFNPPHLRPVPRTGGLRRDATPPVEVDVVDAVAHLIAGELERTRRLDDPVRTLRETERVRHGLLAGLDELQSDCPQAVRALRRRGWSFARIAGETGLSTRRVAELARATHRRT